MRRLIACLCLVASWPLVAMGQAPAPIPTPDTLEKLKADAESSKDAFSAAVQKTTTEEEARAAVTARHARSLILMDKGLTLARVRAAEPEGLAAAAWVTLQAAFEPGDDVAERGDAAYRLLADEPVLDDSSILWAMFVAQSHNLRCPEAESFLRSVIARSRNPDLVTHARYALGCYLAEMARMHDRLAAPVSGPALRKELSQVHLDRCRSLDAAKLRSEAEGLLEEVVREQGSEPRTLGGQAADDLDRIRHLRIGQPAPELVGEDVDGTPIRLGDFRGKVVVLSFWSLADDRRLESLRADKDLVAAMKGRPFALVGVDGDAPEDRAKVKETIAQEGITWRSFWAGGPDGEIPRKWGVHYWYQPTAFIVDAAGILRDDHAGVILTPAALESLVQEAEKAAR